VRPRSNLLRPAAEQPAAATTASAKRATKFKWLRSARRGEVGVAVGIVMDDTSRPPPPPPLARAASCTRSSSNPRRAASLVRRGQKYQERLSRARTSAAGSQRRSIEAHRWRGLG
jgi:hypothetical protein